MDGWMRHEVLKNKTNECTSNPFEPKAHASNSFGGFLSLALYDGISTWSAQAQQLHPPVVQVLFSEQQLISSKTKNFLKGRGKGSKTTFQIEDELRCHTKAQCKTNKDYFEF